MAKKFSAPQADPYKEMIQPQEETPQQEGPKQYYRFNAKLPIECKDYLQEMAWRNRITITEYLANMIRADMEAHPEWRDSLDILNR